MSHLIYSKLTSANTLNGFGGGEGKDRKHYSIEFLPDVKTKLTDKEYDTLIGDGEGMLQILLDQGDFVESAKESRNDVDSLKGELKKLQLKLKAAEKEAEDVAKEESKKDKKEGKKKA